MGAGDREQVAAGPAPRTGRDPARPFAHRSATPRPRAASPRVSRAAAALALSLAGALPSAPPASAFPAPRSTHTTAPAMPSAHAPRIGAAAVRRAAAPCDDPDPTAVVLNDDFEVRWQRGDCRVVVRARMPVEFTADESDVARLLPGGLVTVESHDGTDARVLEIRPGAGGAPAWSWRVDGTPRPHDDEARALLREVLPGLFRQGGFAAAERSRAILAARGADALLDEAGRLHSGAARAVYLDAWLGAAPADRPLHRAIEVARRIDVSAQKSGILLRISRDPAFRPELLPALFAAAATVASESALAELLATVAAEHRLDADARDAYFQAGARLSSSPARARALAALLRPGEADEALLARVLHAAEAIAASETRADLLVRVAAEWPLRGAAREAYLRAAGGIPASGARARALAALPAQEDR